MLALLEIARIYKGINLAFRLHINYDLNLQTAEFLALGLCDFRETLINERH